MSSFRLAFPSEVTAEAVAGVLRVAAAEPRGTALRPATPLVFETLLSRREVGWWLTGPPPRLNHIRAAGERELPGLGWQPDDVPALSPVRAVELRVDSPERLLSIELAEATAQRLLGISAGLTKHEQLLIQWQVGAWLPRSPIRPSARPEPRTIWNLPDWYMPSRDTEQVQAARKKQAEHVFAVVGRVAVAGAKDGRADQLLSSVVSAYQLLRAPGVGVSRRRFPSWLVRSRLDCRRVSQLGPPMRLTAAELAGVIGWPVGNPALPGVRYQTAVALPIDPRLLVAPSGGGRRVVGVSGYPGQAGKPVSLSLNDGLRHLHVLGPTGVGKSTLLDNLILQDIAAGRGLVAIDPKGDLVTDVLARVPERHRERIVVMDPTDPSPVGFNPLAGIQPAGGGLGIDGIMHVLHSIWSSSWGPRLGDVLHAGLLTLSVEPGHGLPELPLLLSDPAFRRPLVRKAMAQDRLGLGSFWPWFDNLSDDARVQVLAPVMNKLRAFLLRPELRAVLGQAEPRFDLTSVFTERKCLLVRLPKGQLGTEGAQLLGSLLVAHLWRLSLRRAAIPADRRRPTFFYLDEFQEFLRLPLDLPDALVQARGLGVGLVLAHQHLDQLERPVRSAVLANAGSRIAFRLDFDDAAIFAKRSRGRLRPDDLSGLDAFQAYASLLEAGDSTAYGSLATTALGPTTGCPETLLALSRDRYGVPRTETEARLVGLVDGPGQSPPMGVIGGRRAAAPDAGDER